MNKVLMVATIALCVNACQSMPGAYDRAFAPIAGAGQQVKRDASNNAIAQSMGKQTIVALSEATSDVSRQFAKYGKVFTVSVVNIGQRPVSFGPDALSVEAAGREVRAMTTYQLQEAARRVELDRKHEMQAREFFTGLLGQLAGSVGNQDIAQFLAIGSKVLQMSNVQEMQNVEEGRAEAAALIQQHANTALAPTTLPKMKATGGWVLVQGPKAEQGFRVRVRVGSDVHTFDFGSVQTANR